MAQILTRVTGVQESDIQPLANIPSLPFKISIEHSLDNKYGLKDMKNNGVKKLHDFIEVTVGRNLTISEVEALYLRKRGLSKDLIRQVVNGGKRDILHFGKDRQPFRIFGYYNSQYFVLTRIDCAHDTNKG